ncbi:MAG TPA: glycosyltransferase, partial [Candidatus Obscuribacterales bacterium]
PEIPNLKYIPPVTGRARSDLLRKAYCVLMPTLYTEPFGGGGVEAMLCGTPLLASDFGAFSETVVHGFTGYRCKTLGDWLYGVKMAGKLDRKAIAQFSRSKYSLETIAPMYTRVFEQVAEMQNQGWYSHVPFMAIPPSDVLRRP